MTNSTLKITYYGETIKLGRGRRFAGKMKNTPKNRKVEVR